MSELPHLMFWSRFGKARSSNSRICVCLPSDLVGFALQHLQEQAELETSTACGSISTPKTCVVRIRFRSPIVSRHAPCPLACQTAFLCFSGLFSVYHFRQ